MHQRGSHESKISSSHLLRFWGSLPAAMFFLQKSSTPSVIANKRFSNGLLPDLLWAAQADESCSSLNARYMYSFYCWHKSRTLPVLLFNGLLSKKGKNVSLLEGLSKSGMDWHCNSMYFWKSKITEQIRKHDVKNNLPTRPVEWVGIVK